MSINLGNTNIGSLYLGSTKISEVYLGSTKVYSAGTPDNVLIFEFDDASYDPSSITNLTGAVWTQLSSLPNVWQWDARNVQDTNWKRAFYQAFNWNPSTNGYVKIISAGTLTIPTILGEILSPYAGMFRQCLAFTDVCALSFPNVTFSPQLFNGCKYINLAGLSVPSTTSLNSAFKAGNRQYSYFTSVGPIVTSSALTDVEQMFYGARALTAAPYFETSGVSNMKSLLYDCNSITTLPLYHTDSFTDIDTAFYFCKNVESGALALYQQMSTQTTPPTKHTNTFQNCGSDTVTGAAELAQIPSSWGGTMA